MEAVTQAVAAEMVGVKPPTIKKWIDTGKLPAYRMGRIVMVKVSDLEEANKRSLQTVQRQRFMAS